MIPIILGKNAGREKILRNRALGEREYPATLLDALHKTFGERLTPEQAVTRILADIRSRGDKALLEWTRKLDGVEMASVTVSQDEIEAAYAETPAAVREALELAAQRVRAFHEKQKPKSWLEWDGESALGQRITPLARVGVYVPGGTAPLPSSLLMATIPAQVARVREIVVATPPMKSGHIQPATLAAANIVGVSRVFAMGGAQAIAALAFGTETVARVDKIVGPGGLFVTLAKRQVFGTVGIDGLYGPTETLLIADDSANPAWVAADLLAQAEHDELATSILITNSQLLADAVAQNLQSQISSLSRREIVAKSLAGQGAIVVVENLVDAIELANAYAPEHLCLLVREPWQWVGKVEHAGGVFVGEWTNEALGDYVIGPSHVMPTAGTARFSSALNVNDFVKISSVFSVGEREAKQLGEKGATLAEAEGLTAHANAIRKRIGGA
ncbi:MAG: histidinol dehydrogenase [Chloroflexi bacterium]|nr:histidinol dehydrogenase [Chloroflexota bacterium]